MSSNMSSTSSTYQAAADKFNSAYNTYSGQNGWNLANSNATSTAETQADKQSSLAGHNAAAQSTGAARSAGVSKAKAAMMGSKAASDTTGSTYGNVYNSTYSTALNGSLANNQATVNQAQNYLNTAQQEGQNQYNRAWGNVGGVGSMVTGLLTSDERLKHFQDVSSKIGKKDDDCVALLKVTYTKKKKE